MSILTGKQIREELANGSIVVDPYQENRIQPNSIDLTLGDEVRVYSDHVRCGSFSKAAKSFGISAAFESHQTGAYLDAKESNDTLAFKMDETGWLVKPGLLYLMHTAEVVGTDRFVTQLNGKSSIARLGVIIHFTAAYGDTGFKGQYTLEVSGLHPVRLYPGMKIAQAVFYDVIGELTNYDGHYTGNRALGAQSSQSWQQF